MKRKAWLFSALFFALSLTACGSTQEELPAGSQAEETAETTQDTAVTEEITEETTQETAADPGITVDSAFLTGDWVDECGFVMRYADGLYTDFLDPDPCEVSFENGAPVRDGEVQENCITAPDENTIRMSDDERDITAVRAESEQGQEYIAALQAAFDGTWVQVESGLLLYYDFKDGKLTTYLDGLEPNTYADYTYTWDGAKLCLTTKLDLGDGEEPLVQDTVFDIRMEDDLLTLYPDGTAGITLCRDGSEAMAEMQNAASEVAGVWVDKEDPAIVWKLNEDGTAEINGKPCTFTAEYQNYHILLTLEDGTAYECYAFGEHLALERGEEKLYLCAEDSEIIRKQRKKQQVQEEKASLLAAYPDHDKWMEYKEFGDIPLLAEEDYITASVQEGAFFVSTPQELASVCYYINTARNIDFLYIELKNDIDLSGYAWAPMGWNGGKEDHPFAAWLNGNGYTISNLHMNCSDSDVGLIGWETFCAVENLTIKDAVIEGGSSTGIITGQAIGGRYENCHVSGTVSGSRAGSMLGYDANTTIQNCTADVLVNGEKFDFFSWNEKEKSEIVIEDPVEITLGSDLTVTRPEVEGYRNLGWRVMYNGVQVLDRNAENELSYRYFGTSPGKYEICLTAYVSGQYVPISNTVTYTIK